MPAATARRRRSSAPLPPATSMGNTLSNWLGFGNKVDQDLKHQLEDDKLAGIGGSNPHEAVASGHQAWASRFDDRDFMSIAMLYTQDCKICPPGSRTAFGRQEAVQGWESLINTGVDRVSFSNTTLEVASPDIISDVSSYHLHGKDEKGGKEHIDHGTHMMIWRKIKDKWFIELHIFSSETKAEKGIVDFIAEMCYMWEYSYYTRDFKSLSSLYTDDCVVCPPAWPQVDGKARLQRFWARFPSMGVDHIERSVIHIEEMGPGHVVAEIGYVMYDYRNGIIDMGRCISICKKSKDGRWCVHNEIFNSDATQSVVITENEQMQSITNTSTESKV